MPSTRLGIAMFTIVRSSSVMNMPRDSTSSTTQGFTRRDTAVADMTNRSSTENDWLTPRSARPGYARRRRTSSWACAARERLGVWPFGGGRPPAAGADALASGHSLALLGLLAVLDQGELERSPAGPQVAVLRAQLLVAPRQPARPDVVQQPAHPRQLGPAEGQRVLRLQHEQA